MKQYESYKNSGVEWIGDIPENWKVKKLKYLAKINSAVLPENFDKNKTIYYIDIGNVDFNNGILNIQEILFKNAPSRAKRVTKNNDIIVSMVRTYLKAIALIDKDGYIVSTGFSVISSGNEINPIFMSFYTKSESFINYISAHSDGVSYPAINQSSFNNSICTIPPELEQQKIASFLDDKSQKIDQFIKNKQRLIELLEEEKKTMITQAVTKGINLDVSYKNSGIEWIGDIPEEWKVESFKNVLVERNKKNNPIESRERLSLSIDKGITLYSEKTTNLDRFKDDFSQYKLTQKGDLVFNSMNMIVGAVGVSNYFGCVSPVYYTYYTRLDNPKITKYYEYFFKSKTVQSKLYSLGKGIMAIDRGEGKFNTVRLKVSRDDLRSIKVPYPPIPEITEIVDFIELKSKKIDDLKAKYRQEIDLIKEYKERLIYDVVTGKMNVLEH